MFQLHHNIRVCSLFEPQLRYTLAFAQFTYFHSFGQYLLVSRFLNINVQLGKAKMAHCLPYLILLVLAASISAESELLVRSQTCPSVYSCANCTAVRICKPHPSGQGFTEYKESNCTGSTPFCNPGTGTCVEFPKTECAKQDEYTCVRDGMFPDPTNCRKFYNCSNLVPHSLACLSNYYYYDSDSESCIYNRGCYTISCSGLNGYKKPYGKDPSLYTYCMTAQTTIMDRCSGNDELNVTTQTCEPTCHCPGLIEDTSDCTRFYKCKPIKPKGNFIMSLHSCPTGYGYDPENFMCVPVSRIPGCKVNSTTTTPTTPTPTTEHSTLTPV